VTKLLIDECLSSELALMARERGHHEASHVVWIGKSGWKDWELKPLLLEEDWVLVTENSDDFRGHRETEGALCAGLANEISTVILLQLS
jgi:hypothetical protein